MKSKFFGIFLLFALALSACNMPVAQSDTTPPVLKNAGTSVENVFYNDNSCGPTRVTVSVDVSDDSGSLSTVGLQYRYRAESNIGASLAWTDVSLSSTSGGHFAGELNVAAEAEPILGQGSGTLEYQVYAVDLAGNISTSPEKNARSISVQRCNGGVASNPSTPNTSSSAPPTPVVALVGKAATPSSNSNNGLSGNSNGAVPTVAPTNSSTSGGYGGGGADPTAIPTAMPTDNNTLSGSGDELVIDTLYSDPSVIYYGDCSNNEATSTTFYADITPVDQYASGLLHFDIYDKNFVNSVGQQFASNLTFSSGSTFSFFSTDLNAALKNFLLGEDGNLKYWVTATSKNGVTSVSDFGYVSVRPCPLTMPTGIPTVALAPTIQYFNGPTDLVEPNSTYTLSWAVSYAACGIYLDGQSVNDTGTQTVTAPYVVNSDTVTHTLEAYGEPCSNPTLESQALTVTVQEANPQPTIVTGGAELGHWDSVDVDYAGGVDITFVQASDKGQLYGENGTVLAEWPYGGSGDPGADNCRLEAGARGSATFDIYNYNHDYVCYITGSGNAGSLNISYMVLQDDPSDAKIMITYETAVLP